MLVTVYSWQYKMDEVRWGQRKHFLLFKSRRERERLMQVISKMISEKIERAFPV